MQNRKQLKNVRVFLTEGTSQKTGKPYAMLQIETGEKLIDINIKPVFVRSDIADLLETV